MVAPPTFLVLLAAARCALAASAADWRGRSIYQILTDRFGRTDNSTTAPCDAADGVYCGGSWQGIINHLDYIQDMGFTAIWISPVTKNLPQSTSDGEAYHGYWQQDLYSLNSNFGTEQDLQNLATELHNRNMYLMVDVVANHNGYAGAGDDVDYSIFNPFNQASQYHSYCSISNYNNQTNVEDCWLGDNIVALADLRTEDADVASEYQSWIKGLVSNYSIDGLRIDTVRNVDIAFWEPFNNAADVFCTGEVFDGDPNYVCPYQDALNSVLNYPIWYPLTAAFESTSGDMGALVSEINTVKSTCKDSTVLGSFSENQDNPRFPSLTSDMALAKNIIAYTILADGVPIIYNGQEQHYSGGAVPDNREAIWPSGYATSSPLYQHIAALNQIRNHALYVDSSYLTYMNYPIYNDTTTIGMRKGSMITVLSNKGADGASYTQSIGNTGYTAGESVVEVLSCTTQSIDSSGNLDVAMGAGAPKVFYPTAQLSGSGICGH